MNTLINGQTITARLAVSNTYFRCTRCRKVKNASAFGFRKMTGTDTVRNQSQCTSCRNMRPNT